jgi:hypothetical protein
MARCTGVPTRAARALFSQSSRLVPKLPQAASIPEWMRQVRRDLNRILSTWYECEANGLTVMVPGATSA